MPPEARILLVEDDPDHVDTLIHDWRFIAASHRLVIQPTTVEEAREAISRLEPDEVDLAVVDGRFPWGSDFESKFAGREIARKLKERFPRLPVIGHAARGDVEGADFQSPKIAGIAALLDLIAKI